MDDTLAKSVAKCLTSCLNINVVVSSSHLVSGGCINESTIIKTNHGNFFVKWNHAGKYPQLFEKEEKGLKILRATEEICIPKPILSGQSNEIAFLILECIDAAPKQSDFWENFGQSLANLHKYTNEKFGLDHNNYIGCLPQDNSFCDNWFDFFINQRLEKQVKLAFDSGKISNNLVKKFKNLYHNITSLFINPMPSLLHGDLWHGNFMTNSKGCVCIFDPAVYYGNRESEIAFTKLFGGFDQKFYNAYNNAFPLQNEFENRIDILNLYPLLVHVNLFGGGYLNQVENVLKKYI